MIEAVRPEEVIVNRTGVPERAQTHHHLFLPKVNDAGEIIGRGAFLGVGVMLQEKAQLVYAQPSQIQPVEVSA